jgi:hypothetical protein
MLVSFFIVHDLVCVCVCVSSAAFFLLIGAKETEKVMEGFIREQISWAEPAGDRGRHWDAIRRFKVLWDSRYHVWPRMEERAQKMFNANSDTEDGKREVRTCTSGCVFNTAHGGFDILMLCSQNDSMIILTRVRVVISPM